MHSVDEILDLVDEQDRVIGQATRRDAHARSLRHRAVHVLLFNSRGELFIQKRAAGKDTFPLCYDSSASGHVDCGESYDVCARREVHEELGLVLPAESLQKHFQITASAETGWEFVWVYSVRGDYRPVINAAEIISGAYWQLADVGQQLMECPDKWAPSFRRVFWEFERRGLLSR